MSNAFDSECMFLKLRAPQLWNFRVLICDKFMSLWTLCFVAASEGTAVQSFLLCPTLFTRLKSQRCLSMLYISSLALSSYCQLFYFVYALSNIFCLVSLNARPSLSIHLWPRVLLRLGHSFYHFIALRRGTGAIYGAHREHMTSDFLSWLFLMF